MSRLTRLQEEVLRRFFRPTRDFFLTGGAALAGYHLGHRTTNDLDLFTTSADLESGFSALREVAKALEASLEALRTSRLFRRFLLSRGSESVVVDHVRVGGAANRLAYPSMPHSLKRALQPLRPARSLA